MDRFESIATFTKVVDEGGFAAAGRALGLSRSAISKAVSRLEGSLGVQLLNRSTRRVSPTDIGLAYYRRSVAILGDLEEADQAAAQLQREPKGLLRLNAPMSFGTLHLAPALADFMALYPDLQTELVLNDRFIDPIEEGFDLTLRIGELRDSSLIARKIAPARRVVCAAPSYLETHGTPQTPSDLRRHRCLHYGYLATGNQWRLTGPDGNHAVPVDGVLCSNNGQVVRAGALAGLGVALSPTFIVGEDITGGALRVILDDYRPPDISIYVIYPPNRHLSAKVRLLTDFLGERFGPRPAWDAGL